MTDAVIEALIVAAAPTLGVGLLYYKTHLAEKARKSDETKALAVVQTIEKKVDEVKVQGDGHFSRMLEMMMKMSEELGYNKGIDAEKQDEKDRHKI